MLFSFFVSTQNYRVFRKGASIPAVARPFVLFAPAEGAGTR
jgi:hypothetical protein